MLEDAIKESLMDLATLSVSGLNGIDVLSITELRQPGRYRASCLRGFVWCYLSDG